MAIKHATTKAPGQKLFAVADWNANHTIQANTITAPMTDFIDDGTAAGQLIFWGAAGRWTHTETTELFWDDANKRLGIGIATPLQKLTIDASTATQYAVVQQDATHNIALGWIYNATPANAYGILATFALTNPLRIDASVISLQSKVGGNVGIGTTNPGALLSIRNVGSSDNVDLLDFSEADDDEFSFEGMFAGAGATGNSLKLRSVWTDNIMIWGGDGGIHTPNMKSGTDQANAGAVAGELYFDTNDDNTVKMGV